jgi:hypothetical protein
MGALRGQTTYTHGIVRITGILRLMPSPRLPTLGLLSTWPLWLVRCIPVVLSTRSTSHRGVFGTPHSDPSLSGHSLSSNLRLVSQSKSRLEGLIARRAKRGKKKCIREGGLLRAFFHTYASNLTVAGTYPGGVVLKLKRPVLKNLP